MNKKILVFTGILLIAICFIKITCEGVSKGKTLVSIVDKNDMYRYKNVLELGLIVFLLFLLWNQFHILGTYNGQTDSIRSMMDAAGDFSIIMFPVAFVMSILISLSNIRLMMKEGKTWRNMLGLILGLMLMTGTVIPVFIGNILQTNPYLNVHEESGIGHLIEMAVDSTLFIVVAYLECILIGSILYGIKAARHIPRFDKDYILILGCQIRKDGTLTP